ncbi:MAG: disulfide bond formation protein B [Alphaproteobacteria bacterium]|nr:disulfide bond formation protein B [Alphaproteobacteria bacterium]MBL6938881.1 disulfide bond formation protein B [Alphaproteobacteria bacterium]MBL7099473.1 disulfide bond formation protein B [Alphaproteobacteria bacterium]
MKAERIALFEGAVSLALIAGALLFQYVGHYPPCEMCHWQRWPHIASAVIGLGGGLLLAGGVLPGRLAPALAVLAVLAVAISGALGIFHAGVEWHFWPGPTACTTGFHYTGGPIDLNAPVPHCDIAAWRLFGISMAGYNAVTSLGAAALGTLMLVRRT